MLELKAQNAQACPEPLTLSHYLTGELSVAEIDTVAAHVEACATCLENLSRLSPNLVLPAFQTLPTATLADIGTGSRLRDYLILDSLGHGGMGAVFKARHTRLDKIVALKIIRPGAWTVNHAVRFEREMRAVGRVNDPRIVQALDAGEVDGVPFLVMEHVEGVTLSAWVKANGPVDAVTACKIVAEAAGALQHAHEAGLVHRDVKPGNIMRTPDGRIKLLDLGLAMMHETPEPPIATAETAETVAVIGELTSPSRMLGTLDYMAPEQRTNPHAVDARADVYGLGGVLWYLVSGDAPHRGPRPTAIPAATWDRLLATDPAARCATAEEVAALLQPRRRRWHYAIVAFTIVAAFGFILFFDPEKKPDASSIVNEVKPNQPAAGALGMSEADAVALQQTWADHLGVPVISDGGNATRFAVIPPGTVVLGVNFNVTISKPYELATTEVTLEQFRRFVTATGHATVAETDGKGGSWVDFDAPPGQKFKNGPQFTWRTPGPPVESERCPVTQVGYADAVAYCDWLTTTTGRTHRLPTEAEWLWAYRTGSAADPAAKRATKPAAETLAWVRQTSGSPTRPHPVAHFAPNAWGLHDMLGNVTEICLDDYKEYPTESAVDYRGREPVHRFPVLQGSCYYSVQFDINNIRGRLNYGGSSVGFRVLREVKAPER
jgi:serine/threonine protein kinase